MEPNKVVKLKLNAEKRKLSFLIFLKFILSILVLGTVVFLFWVPSFYTKATLIDLVNSDLQQLQKKDFLPEAWHSIREIKYRFQSEKIKQAIDIQKLSVSKKNNGQYNLEIEFIEVPDDKKPKMLMQMNLIEIKSKNTIWELGRTYVLFPQ